MVKLSQIERFGVTGQKVIRFFKRDSKRNAMPQDTSENTARKFDLKSNGFHLSYLTLVPWPVVDILDKI